ncbi:MAG: DUF952 domain-containing protein [Alphaproteobacteria bacterium]|nr:DUF952 domain-containing protein [Alphaproteobacteria bacterium]
MYRLIAAADWQAARSAGLVPLRDIDRRDGYLHLSTGDQVLETARLHFAGAADLVALEIDESALEGDIKFEPARGGELFPHLYGTLPVSAVRRARRLLAAADGFVFEDAP